MATYTSFLNLEKPTTSERLDVLKINSNWDKIDEGVSSLNSKIGAIRTTGYVGVLETFSTSGTSVNFTIPSDGLYAVRASTGSTAGTLSAFMFENSGANITNVQKVAADAWATIFTPPMPMIAGTQIKAQFIGPSGASGAIVKYGN